MPTATPVLTITKPDGSTEITATYLDGTLKSTTGSGVPDVFYQYGTHTEQGGGSWTKTIKGASSGTEWTKEYTDLLGRPIKTEYPDGAVAVKTYFPPDASSGSIGKLSGSRDPDGVESAITYNLEGELSTFTEDIPGGQHRITSSETDVVDDPLLGVAYRSRKWINGVLITSEFTSSEGVTGLVVIVPRCQIVIVGFRADFHDLIVLLCRWHRNFEGGLRWLGEGKRSAQC
jgi:hypothetical protein